MARRASSFPAFAWLAFVVWIAPAPVRSESATVSPGEMVRLRPPARIEIPDILRIDSGRLQTGKPFEDRDGVVIVQDGDRTLHVPRPGKTLSGRLVAVTDELDTLLQGERTILVPRQAVERLEVRRRGHATIGALVGAAAGFAIGYAIGHESDERSPGSGMRMDAGPGVGLLLAIPGGVAGAVLAGEKWRPASIENVGVGVAVRRDGAAAGVSFRF